MSVFRVPSPAGAPFLLDVRPAVHVLSRERSGIRHMRVLHQGPFLPLLQRRRGHVHRQAVLVHAVSLLCPLGNRVAPLLVVPLYPVLPPN